MTNDTVETANLLVREGFRGEILHGEPLSRHTSLKVGGPADLMAFPVDTEDLLLLVSTLDRLEVARATIGGGYNLLVRDEGFRGCVISTVRLDRITIAGKESLTCEAGVPNRKLVATARDARLSGVEFLCSIPGTVGGAIRMNAGAHGSAIMGIVEEITLVRDGGLRAVPRSDLTFGYRHLSLQPGDVIVSARMRLVTAPKEEIVERIRRYRQYRLEHQKVSHPSAGSFFRNPPGEPAWKLIDGAGMRGARVGGAQVAEEHANFLVNTGNASASDFLELAAMIRMKVFERYGIMLEEEVELLPSSRKGEDGDP